MPARCWQSIVQVSRTCTAYNVLRLKQTPEFLKMQISPFNTLSRAIRVRRVTRSPALAAVAMLVMLFGCASDTSFDRHNLSRLWLSDDGKQLFFDATVNTAYPEADPAAEMARKTWIEQWLKLRSFCESGYAIAERRKIRPEEYNPMRHDLRYELACN